MPTGDRAATPTLRRPVAAAPRPVRDVRPVHWRGALTLFNREVARVLKEWPETVLAPSFSSLVYLAVFALALGPERGTPEAEAVIGFVLPGLVVLALLTRAAETPMFTLVFDKLEGTIADVLMPPLSAGEITAAYACASAVAALATMAPLLAAAVLLFGLPVPGPLTLALFSVGGALMMGIAGVVLGLWAEKWDHVQAAFTFLLLPVIFLSGVFAPVAALPGPVEAVARANPIFYAIDGFRAGASGGHSVDPALSFAIVAATTLALWALAWRLVARGYKIRS